MAIGSAFGLGMAQLKQAMQMVSKPTTQPTTPPTQTEQPNSLSPERRRQLETELRQLERQVASYGNQSINLQGQYDRIAQIKRELAEGPRIDLMMY